jgi:hypothetical protein
MDDGYCSCGIYNVIVSETKGNNPGKIHLFYFCGTPAYVKMRGNT